MIIPYFTASPRINGQKSPIGLVERAALAPLNVESSLTLGLIWLLEYQGFSNDLSLWLFTMTEI